MSREKNLKKKSEEAFRQIEEKQYDVEMKQRGIRNIVTLGIAFCGKTLKVYGGRIF